MTVYLCGNCNKQLPVSDACFCNYCGVHLVDDEETQLNVQVPECAKQQQTCNQTRAQTCNQANAQTCNQANTQACKQANTQACKQANTQTCNQANAQTCNQTRAQPCNQVCNSNANDNANTTYAIEDMHSFALRLRERILRSSGNARRGFRTMTDGTDSSAISRDRFVAAVRSTWSFAGVPVELVEATVDKYLRPNNGFVTFETFSDFVTNGPEKLNICLDEQTVLSQILLPIQEGFLRKHYTPHAAFRSIPAHGQGFVTIQDIRNHVDKYLRIIFLSNVNDDVFKEVIQRAANINGEKLTYNDFSRMLSYPYVGQQQWRQPSTSPRAADVDNHPYRKFY